jgi:hypothetical protein
MRGWRARAASIRSRKVAAHMTALGNEHRHHRNARDALRSQTGTGLSEIRFEKLEKGEFNAGRRGRCGDQGCDLAQRSGPLRIARSVSEQYQAMLQRVFSLL